MRKPTNEEIRAIENHIEQAEKSAKIKRIKDILRNDAVEICGCCGLKFVPFLTLEGYGVCPKCDVDIIEKYEAKKAV